jgi:predicted DNA-binding protein (MmcQ/YjbR family)
VDIEEIRDYCLKKVKVTEGFPFNETVLVFKVMDKMFLLTDLGDPSTVNLKCDPEYAIELREKHDDIVPGYHMSKKHWNTVSISGSLSKKLILSLIDHSYDQVVLSLPAKVRRELSS